MITWWQLILDEIVLVTVLIVGIGAFNRRSLVALQRLIAEEVKAYLTVILEEHRDKAAEIVGQGVEARLMVVKEELRVALADVVQAEAAQDVAETATRAKSDFLSKMSHEIRTPINGIVGSLDLLDPAELTTVQAEDVNRAILSSNRLLGIINQILDFAKIEAAEIEYLCQPFDLGQVVGDVISVLAPQAQQKGLLLGSEISDDLALARLGDGQKIHQVLLNLVENAVKFTDQGSVELKVALADSLDGVRVQVQDTGVGIAKGELKAIFESFVQVGQSSPSGTGLGLSICQEFVAGMGGQLEVDSQPDIGTTFSFELELKTGTGTGTEAEAEAEAVQNDIKVLVVDDDVVNQQVARRYLETMGVQATVVADGKQAVSSWKKDGYDLILMDLQMPVMNGFEATAEIRRLEKMVDLKPVRIVALTASLVGQVEEQCHQAGMDGYLAKPFRRQDLLTEMERSK